MRLYHFIFTLDNNAYGGTYLRNFFRIDIKANKNFIHAKLNITLQLRSNL